MPTVGQTGLGTAAFANTPLALATDDNSKSLLEALKKHFDQLKIEASVVCTPSSCGGDPKVAALDKPGEDYALAFAGDLGEREMETRKPARSVKSATKAQGTAPGERLLSVSLDPAGGIAVADITAATGTLCKRYSSIGFVTGDSGGRAHFRIKASFKLDATVGAAAVEYEIDISGEYNIRVGYSLDPMGVGKPTAADFRKVEPVYIGKTFCLPPECKHEDGEVAIAVSSYFNFKMTMKATTEFEIAGIKFAKKVTGALGAAASGEVEGELEMRSTYTARVGVSC